MIRCPHCNAHIRYIANAQDIFTVDAQEKTLITAHGRIVKGYPLHVCPLQIQEADASCVHTNGQEVLH